MIHGANPYDHLSTPHLKRQLRKVSRRLTRIALKGGSIDERFEYQRVIMLSISNALDRRDEKEMLEKMAAMPTLEETPAAQ